MQEAIAEKEYKQDVLINLIIKAKTDDDEDLIHFTQEKEFAEQLSKQLGVSNVWVASVELIVEEAADQQALQKMYPNEWDKVLRKAEKTTIFNELTERIFEQIPSRYLNQKNSKAYREQMIQKAIAKLHLK
jgi:hypothetical protein